MSPYGIIRSEWVNSVVHWRCQGKNKDKCGEYFLWYYSQLNTSVPCITRASAAWILTMRNGNVLVSIHNEFQQLVMFQYQEMIYNEHIFFIISQINSIHQSCQWLIHYRLAAQVCIISTVAISTHNADGLVCVMYCTGPILYNKIIFTVSNIMN